VILVALLNQGDHKNSPCRLIYGTFSVLQNEEEVLSSRFTAEMATGSRQFASLG